MRFRQTLVWTVLGSCLSIWLASHGWGFEAGQEPAGLTGLIPAYAPDGLTAEDFKKLAEAIEPTWKDWVAETSQFVHDFYEGEHPTVDDQRIAIQNLKVKIKTLEKALADARYRSIRPQLETLYGRLAPRVDLAEALLDTLSVDEQTSLQLRLQPAMASLQEALRQLTADLERHQHSEQWKQWIRLSELKDLTADHPQLDVVNAVKAKLEKRETYSQDVKAFVSRESFLRLEDALAEIQAAARPHAVDRAALRKLLSDLVEAVNAYRNDPSAQAESQVRQAYDKVRSQAPDGGAAISRALGADFLNYNLRLVVSEGLVNRFFQETRRESSTVSDRVMEAQVYGCQTSDVTTRIDFAPSTSDAILKLKLSGKVYANTNGYTSQATIHTIGNHTFTGEKRVVFDGQNFSPQPATVSVSAHNQTVGASTKFNGVPILGGVARNIAMREASARTPQANAIAASKISSQVREQLDREADRQFADASQKLQSDTYGPLRKYNLYPAAMSVSTSENELRLFSRVMDEQELGGSRAIPVSSVPADGLVAEIHETLPTRFFDRIGLAGKTLTEDEFRQLLESRLSEILNRKVEIPKPENAPSQEEQSKNKLVFADHDPVRFTFADGIATIIIRAGMKRDNGDDIPTQIISVPFTPTLSEGKVLLTRGNVGVKPVSRPPNIGAQVTRAQIMRQKIQSALPERTVDAGMDVEQNNKKVHMNVTRISVGGGWLTLTVQ